MMLADRNQHADSPDVVALAQHPRYQHAEWSVTERIARWQGQVLRARLAGAQSGGVEGRAERRRRTLIAHGIDPESGERV